MVNIIKIDKSGDQEGFITDGPKCGYKGCGGTDWIIRGDTPKCTEGGHKRSVSGLKGYIKGGPKCGYKGCGGKDWFVGKNKWKCTKGGHTR